MYVDWRLCEIASDAISFAVVMRSVARVLLYQEFQILEYIGKNFIYKKTSATETDDVMLV